MLQEQQYRVVREFRGSPDGINTIDYRVGTVVTFPSSELSLALARLAVQQGYIVRRHRESPVPTGQADQRRAPTRRR